MLNGFLLLVLSLLALLFKSGILCSLVIFAAFMVSMLSSIRLLRYGKYLSCLFVLVYLALYFPNPFLIGLGVLDLEPTTSTSLFALTNGMLIAGIALFLFGVNIMKQKYVAISAYRIYFSRSTILTILSSLFGLAAFAFFFTIAFGGGWKALTAERAQYGRVWVRLAAVYMYLPFLAVAPLLIVQLSKPLQTIPWIIAGAILLGNFLLFRARTPLLTVMFSVVIGILLKNRVLFVYEQLGPARAPTLRRYLLAGILVPAMLVVGVAINFLRGFVSVGPVRLGHDFVRVWVEQTFDGGDLGYTKIQRAAYVLFPNAHPFLKGQSYYRLLLVPMPRFIWTDKPENTQRVFCSVINPAMYKRGGTIPPGILGDLYINFGHIGIIGMFVYGLVFGLERYHRLAHWFMLGGALTWLFHFARGGFTNPVIVFLVYVVISFTTERILNPRYELAEDTELGESISYDIAS